MEKTLQIINQLQAGGLIENYALGGAVAAIFYIEPILTYDLDVFIFLPEQGKPLISLSPIYDDLREKGYQVEGEHIVIEGVPVQFIPAYNDLVEEAVKEAREIEYNKVATRVLQVEHLIAIMLQTDRPKDRTRIAQVLEEAEVNMEHLAKIFERHGLTDKWQDSRRRYYDK